MPKRPYRFSQRGWSSSWTEVEGVRMHARVTHDEPAGPTVVLLHGLLVSSRYMSPLARALSPTSRVLAPDMPGFGRSDDPDRVLDVNGLADRLGGWLEERELRDVVLVANSFGCQYAARLMAEGCDRVRSLVLLGPTTDPTKRTALRQALLWAANAPFEPPSLGLVITRDLVDCGPIRAALTYRHGLRHAIEDELPRIEVETLVVRGERDTLVTRGWAERAVSLLSNGRLGTVPKAGHTINYNSAGPTAALILPMLEGRPGA